MEHSLILLLLFGLALLLATSTSLLATSGSGRGEDGDEDSSSFLDCNNHGEISGSTSVTSTGELWITIYIDQLSILAKIEVVEGENKVLRYKFSVTSISFPTESDSVKKPHYVPKDALETHFDSPDQAVKALILMFKKIGIEFTDASIQSIPHAICCGWRSPEECKEFIQRLLEKQHTKERL